MSFEAVLGNKEFEVSEVTMTVVTRSSTSGGHGVSVLESVTGTAMVGRTLFKAKTVSLALLTSTLLSGSKNFFFNPKDSSYLYLLTSLLVFFLTYYYKLILESHVILYVF
jgi:hypothetical protein